MVKFNILLCLLLFSSPYLAYADELRFVSPEKEHGGEFYCEEYSLRGRLRLRKSGYLYRMTPVFLTGERSRARDDYVFFKSSNGARGFIRESSLAEYDFNYELKLVDQIVVHIHHHDSTKVEFLEDQIVKVSNRSVAIPMKVNRVENGYYLVDAILEGRTQKARIDIEGEDRLYKLVPIGFKKVDINKGWFERLTQKVQEYYTELDKQDCASSLTRDSTIGVETKFLKAGLSINGSKILKREGVVFDNSPIPFLDNEIYAPRVFMCENNNPERMISLSVPDIGILFNSNQFSNNDFAKPYFKPYGTTSADRKLSMLKMVELSRPLSVKEDYFSAIAAIEREIRGDMPDVSHIDQIVHFILINTVDFHLKN